MSSGFLGRLRRRIRRAIGAETREGETLSGIADILRQLPSEQLSELSTAQGELDTHFQELLERFDALEDRLGDVEKEDIAKQLQAMLEGTKEQHATLSNQVSGVRDQHIKDRTTFLERLKALQDDWAKRERELKNEMSGVRDQLVQDRTAYGEHLKRFEQNSLSKQREVADEISPIPQRISGVEKQLEKTLEELRENKPVLQRIKESWLHPDYYYKNMVGLMEDRRRLLYKAIDLLEKNSRVLDIGPGNCFAMEAFRASGHHPVGIGLDLESYVPKEILGKFDLVEADYNNHEVSEPYDAIWASHVLEHQPDKQSYVRKMFKDLKKDGWLFVLVPPMKAEVVGGHLNLFNTGYLLYTLVVGGFNCKNARVTKYGYNVVVFVRKKGFEMPQLRYDSGDLETLAPYFPFEVTQNFNGLHLEINWEW